MTENHIYPFISSFFDVSTNSSDLLKLDYRGNNSTATVVTPTGSLTQGLQAYTSMDNLRENPMLTTAISIPQRSGGAFQPRIMVDFSEFGLEALDSSSLSPHMLQDISLTGMSGINGQINSGNMNTISGDNVIMGDTQATTGNSNTMWSDIGNAMITTKTEPFQIEDDYIFQIDKADLIQGPTLAELNDETLLEDLNIEDFIHVDRESYLNSPHQGGHLQQLQSPSHINTSLSTSVSPHHHILQQQQHSPQQSHHHHQQTQRQQETIVSPQFPNSATQDVIYDEHNTTGSSSPYDIYYSTPTKSFNSSAAFSPASQGSSNSPLMINSVTPPPHANRSQYHPNIASHSGKTKSPALHELLKKEYSMSPDRSMLGQSVPGPSTSHMIMSGNALSPVSSGFGSTGRKTFSTTGSISGTSRLSSSAPTHLGLEQIWQRREPRQHLLSTGSLAEAESFSSISTGSVLSPEANDFSHDEGYSDYDSDHYEDYTSDNGSDNEDDIRSSHPNKGGKERYFWQYNVQAKGPKGQRLVIKTQQEDPHVLNEVTDPVFSPNCSVRGIKVFKVNGKILAECRILCNNHNTLILQHSGKARKGDGNDLTPNPRKLHNIGKELDKLGRTINDMTPVSELPFNVRPKSRKEKNKLASRACRLKKKAQHEANKIKLYGLEVEHKKLLNGINDIKRILAIKYQNQSENPEELNQQIDRICKASTKLKIAGTTTEFVNKILEKVKAGTPSGGLEELKSI